MSKTKALTFPEMCLQVRADLVKKVHALDELLRNFHEGALAEDSPAVKDVRAKVKRAYTKRANKTAKGGGKQRAKKVEKDVEAEGPRRRDCPRCHQSKLYEPGRHGNSTCADCEKKSKERAAGLAE